MKIIIVGAGTIGLGLAAQMAEEVAKLGIDAEARQATPAEESHCQYMERHVQEVCIRNREEPVIAFEQPRFNGYMGHKRKRPPERMKVIGWK
ncbi:hypothetical protein [Hymenobacter cheonanensis]|uniref:hypothetical protein n=1 Tax=Hymenobacter sp. CA2-7 TaxID=3063993 RepID=UPI002713B121|nr:hypothetical protein [Hymenobacter sp. CA2-7]MDO7885357.1 hypothetical protein [Hymenobacter sp. CA2-7]